MTTDVSIDENDSVQEFISRYLAGFVIVCIFFLWDIQVNDPTDSQQRGGNAGDD